ncbi:MAG TPA: hypothetical protein VIZ43_08510 [Trebonia sp.]
MTEIQPPILADTGVAPTGACSRWIGDSPCGAAGTHHVIWDLEMHNSCICPAHVSEARERWVFIGLHPYTAACAGPPGAFWLADEDRCEVDKPLADHIARELGVSR